MVAQAFDVINGLLPDIVYESLVAWIHGTGEHEILPDQ